MKSRFMFLIVSLLTLPSFALAGEISGLKVSKDSTILSISWDALNSTDYSGMEGYAVSWGDQTTKIRTDKYPRQFTTATSISIRGNDFEREKYYYFRVFAYQNSQSGKKELYHASKGLKWKYHTDGTYTATEVSISDPVTSSTSTSSGSTADDIFDFGALRSLAFDTFVDIGWSKPTGMVSSDYDGFKIQISKESGFSNVITEMVVDRDTTIGRFIDLEPNTQYYLRGGFNDNGRFFGEGNVKSFRTIQALNRETNTRASRNIRKIESKAVHKTSIIGGSTSFTKNNSTTTTSSSSTSNNTTATSVEDFDLEKASTTAMKNRLDYIGRMIKKLENERKAINKKLGSADTGEKKATTRNTRTMSIRDRIRERMKNRKSSSRSSSSSIRRNTDSRLP